jgi:hypothetical protein
VLVYKHRTHFRFLFPTLATKKYIKIEMTMIYRISFQALLLCCVSRHNFVSAIIRTTEHGSSDFTFVKHPVVDNIVQRSLQVTTEEVLESYDICGGWELIANEIPNGEQDCLCQDSQVQCALGGKCAVDRSVCTDVVDISFQFLVADEAVNQMKLSACFTYTDEFEATCIEALIGKGQKLEACERATYGGKDCLCAICGDEKSLSLDCSSHHPLATSNGCYLLSEALPILAKFDQPPQSG